MNRAEFYLEDLKSKFTKINPEDYYLAYSGGRDSHFLFWFIREYLKETRIPAVFNNTGMEIPEIRERALANADVVLKPVKKHAEIKEKYGIPLNTKTSDEWVYLYQRKVYDQGFSEDEISDYLKWVIFKDVSYAPKGHEGHLSFVSVASKTAKVLREGKLHRVSPYCCKYLKKIPGIKYAERERERGQERKKILGVMGSESFNRKNVYKSCFSQNGTFSPLWDLTDDLRNEIEKQFDIPVPHAYLYTEQTGCAGCPYGQHGKNRFRNTDINLSLCGSGQQKFILDYFKESYEFKGYHFQPIMFL